MRGYRIRFRRPYRWCRRNHSGHFFKSCASACLPAAAHSVRKVENFGCGGRPSIGLRLCDGGQCRFNYKQRNKQFLHRSPRLVPIGSLEPARPHGQDAARILLGCGGDVPRAEHLEHFMCVPASGTGVSPGSDAVACVRSRSWQQSRQNTHNSLLAAAKISERNGSDHTCRMRPSTSNGTTPTRGSTTEARRRGVVAIFSDQRTMRRNAPPGSLLQRASRHRGALQRIGQTELKGALPSVDSSRESRLNSVKPRLSVVV